MSGSAEHDTRSQPKGRVLRTSEVDQRLSRYCYQLACPRMQADLSRRRRGRDATGRRRGRLLAMLAAVAGPLLIIVAVLVVLRRYAFTGRISTEDLLRYWLPMYDFLGKSLKSGHIPGWNPYVVGGTPFAADPQSGWMQVLPMILFSGLPVELGIRWLVVIQPMIAGIGLYAFLRSEGTSRPAATIGGLALALVVSSSRLPVSIRFPGALAWTTVSLAACSRYLRATLWSRRIPWALATALAWGQVAASHLSVGLLLGTGSLLAFMAVKTASNVRGGVWTGRAALALSGLLALSLPLVNLAYLLPRLAFSTQTSVSLGYGRLHDLSIQLTGTASPPFPGLAAGPDWPLNLATFPGRYVGATALLLAFAGFWSNRYRGLAVGFSAYGAVCYGLGLKAVAYRVPHGIRSVSVVDQYLHHPYWLSFGVLLAIAVMAGIGVEAWRESKTARQRVLMIVPALAVWLLLPIGVGARASELLLLVVAGAVSGVVLVVAVRHQWAMVILPGLMVAEIMTTVVLGSSRLPFKGDLKLLADLDRPTASIAGYLNPTPLSQVMAEHPGRRYYTVARPPGRTYFDRRALQNDESMVLGVENAGGYQAVQLERYWLFVRRLQHTPMRYQYALFVAPPPAVSDLLDVGWVIAPSSQQAGQGLLPVADDGEWTLYRRALRTARATVVGSWTVVGSPQEALNAVARPGFEPNRTAILEQQPGIVSARGVSAPGTASYRPLGAQAARIEVNAPGSSIVLIRNVWERNWRATVDGKPVSVMPADYVVQGVAVPEGRHTILLTYDDPTIGYGMLGSSLAVMGLLAWAWFAARRETTSSMMSGRMAP